MSSILVILQYFMTVKRNYQVESRIQEPEGQDQGLCWQYEIMNYHIDGTQAILQLNACIPQNKNGDKRLEQHREPPGSVGHLFLENQIVMTCRTPHPRCVNDPWKMKSFQGKTSSVLRALQELFLRKYNWKVQTKSSRKKIVSRIKLCNLFTKS